MYTEHEHAWIKNGMENSYSWTAGQVTFSSESTNGHGNTSCPEISSTKVANTEPVVLMAANINTE